MRDPLSHQTRLTITYSFGIVVFIGFGGCLDGLVGHLCGQYWSCKKDCDYHCRLETLMLIAHIFPYRIPALQRGLSTEIPIMTN